MHDYESVLARRVRYPGKEESHAYALGAYRNERPNGNLVMADKNGSWPPPVFMSNNVKEIESKLQDPPISHLPIAPHVFLA
jgi:hypothetical protein